MPHHLEFEQWVPFPLERVSAFFSNPENLPRIMPASTGTRLIRIDRIAPPPTPMDAAPAAHHAVGVGSTIITSFRIFPLLPIRAHWTSHITEFEWNHHFVDVRDQGPFQRWHHRHQFERQTHGSADGTLADGTLVDGTLVRDFVDYEVGFGLLGDILDWLFIAPQMRNTFVHRQRILPRLLS
jgi:ligand-binding SRPBCC domain-containing protein